MRPILAIALLLVFSVVAKGVSDFEFVGVTTTASGTLVGIRNAHTNTCAWSALGQSFEGYLIVSFQEGKQTLTLRRGDEILELPLKSVTSTNGNFTAWVHPQGQDIPVTLVISASVEVTVTDKEGTVLYRGHAKPGDRIDIPYRNAMLIETDTPEAIMVNVHGKQWPMKDPRTKTYLKKVKVQLSPALANDR